MIPAEEKLGRLKNLYPSDEDTEELEKREEDLRKALVAAELFEREEVKLIVDDGVKRIIAINSKISNEKTSELDRQKLFAERRTHYFWLARLAGKRAKRLIKGIESWADDKIKEQL